MIFDILDDVRNIRISKRLLKLYIILWFFAYWCGGIGTLAFSYGLGLNFFNFFIGLCFITTTTIFISLICLYVIDFYILDFIWYSNDFNGINNT